MMRTNLKRCAETFFNSRVIRVVLKSGSLSEGMKNTVGWKAGNSSLFLLNPATTCAPSPETQPSILWDGCIS